MAKQHASPLVPPTALVTKSDADIVDLAFDHINAFEKALGGRQELINSLSIDASPEVRDLMAMLLDPRYDGRSIGWLAQKAEIGLSDLLRAYRSGVMVKAQILATQKIAAQLPSVVEDVMKRAAPYDEPCEACDATGEMKVRPTKKVPVPEPPTVLCTVCRGKKVVKRLPELDRQRLALEISEFLKTPKSGPLLMQQFNLPNAGAAAGDTGAGALERMQQAVTSVLFDRNQPVIDLEPVLETDDVASEK